MPRRESMNIAKWLPIQTEDNKRLFLECQEIRNKSDLLVFELISLLQDIQQINIEILEQICEDLQALAQKYKSLLFKIDSQPFVEMIKMKQLIEILHNVKLKLIYILQQLMNGILYFYEKQGDKLMEYTLKICHSINELLMLDLKYNFNRKISLSKNNCPHLYYPIRKITLTRIVQILAQNRAEICCHRLIDSLLENYKFSDHSGSNGNDDNNSDTSSIEIYRALTRHMTPPIEINIKPVAQKTASPEKIPDQDDDISVVSNGSGDESLQALEILLNNEEKLVYNLLHVAKTFVPKMLGSDGIKKSKRSGELKINHKTSTKVLEYYEQILWGEAGNYLEHVVLWWGAAPLAARLPHSSQHLREWILQFTPTALIPTSIIAALHSLADALGCHVTSTLWDQNFRLALVSAQSKRVDPDTGKLFADMLHDLVMLNNQCEVTNDWIVGAPLEELPLVEQIPVLHRLDHSIHTTRLWAASETRKLANCWNVDCFFSIIQVDIKNCLAQLKDLRMDDHTVEISKGGLSVHVEVCANMREKLVSEVKVNMSKLNEVTKECIDVLAKICRTVCLANLQMIFPTDKSWRKVTSEHPKIPNSYVSTYLDRVLLPVLEATNDHIISNMVLRIMCEAWLDHIYINRIKFSHFGALQLLIDFGSVADWLTNCLILTPNVRKHMLHNEVLRRCEGVGRILLRSPGEHIDMGKDITSKKTNENSKSTGNEDEPEEHANMPAEMYVPNQEQWLELRATKKKMFLLLPSLCCQLEN